MTEKKKTPKKKPSVSKSNCSKGLSAEAMKRIGFTEKWPGGNPKEPWWENPKGVDMERIWFTKLPTRKQFWDEIAECFREQGREEVRDMLKKALGR
jgi:hypothetical protein